MIGRRSLLKAAGTAVVIPGSLVAIGAKAHPHTYTTRDISELDPLDTMVRMRADTSGALAIGWLDAVRETVIDSEIRPFCRILSFGLSKFVREGDIYRARIFEVAYYCEPGTNRLLETFTFPGRPGPVAVPIYRTGPKAVNFGVALDEWEENTGKPGQGGPAPEFAPVATVHLERDVGRPALRDGEIHIRADEYGRVYPDVTKPPPVFYREWTIWRADADAILNSDATSVDSNMSYNAVSALRPWMKMENVVGHTVENGFGGKVGIMAALPDELRELLTKNDPDVLKNPEGVMT